MTDSGPDRSLSPDLPDLLTQVCTPLLIAETVRGQKNIDSRFVLSGEPQEVAQFHHVEQPVGTGGICAFLPELRKSLLRSVMTEI